MAATISAVRDALKTTLSNISGLRVFDTIPDNVNPPCAVVVPERGVPRTIGLPRDTQEYRVRLFVGRLAETVAQDRLDEYLSSTGTPSIRAAIAASSNLGIQGVKAVWMGWENYGQPIEVNGVIYLTADVLVTVEN